MRNELLRGQWSLETRSGDDPEKVERTDALSVIDPSAVLASLNRDGLTLLRRLCTPNDWRQFVSGELSPSDQARLLERLSFALFQSEYADAREQRRFWDLHLSRDYQIGEHLGTAPITDEAPVPNALEVLDAQREFFIRELGVVC